MTQQHGAGAVVVGSGHMVDAPDRPTPRFPPSQVGRVSRAVAETLQAWEIGPDSTIVTGGARGTDIIVAESGLALSARLLLCLALPPEEFASQSVALPDTDWTARFQRLLERAEVRVLADEARSVSDDVFARANVFMLQTARALTDHDLRAIVVWNGEDGDGPGGTADFIQRARNEGVTDDRLRVIDPAVVS